MKRIFIVALLALTVALGVVDGDFVWDENNCIVNLTKDAEKERNHNF